MATGFLGLPTALEPTRDSLRRIAVMCNNLLAGKLNVRTTVRLLNGATTTTISDPRIGANSHLSLEPLSANAAAIVTSIYLSSQGKQTATWTHTSTANADQNFSLSITG